MIGQKLLGNIKYFNYLGNVVADSTLCTRAINSKIAMAEAALNRKKKLFVRKLDLNFRKKLVKYYV
jgi:hypothetical protein